MADRDLHPLANEGLGRVSAYGQVKTADSVAYRDKLEGLNAVLGSRH